MNCCADFLGEVTFLATQTVVLFLYDEFIITNDFFIGIRIKAYFYLEINCHLHFQVK